MQFRRNRHLHDTVDPARIVRRPPRALSGGTLAGAVLLASLAAAPQLQSQQPADPANPIVAHDGDRPLDSKPQLATAGQQQSKKQRQEAANLDRKREITDDSAKLLQLASDLKAAVDKSSKDTLSVSVVRKADEIERLARNVREKMKLSMSASN